jgi:hypothetical protein
MASVESHSKRSSWPPSVSQDSKENQADEHANKIAKYLIDKQDDKYYPGLDSKSDPEIMVQTGVGILFVWEEDPSGFVCVTVKLLLKAVQQKKLV